MNTRIHLRVGFGLLILAIFQFLSVRASAQTITLLSEDFSSGQPPSWSNDGTWFSSSNGNGDYNGSMYVDMWDYWFGNDVLTTGSVDASGYTGSGDSVWVDFD